MSQPRDGSSEVEREAVTFKKNLVADGSVLRLIRLFVEALIQDGYRLMRPKAGTPQGGVVSPLSANIYLGQLDRVLEAEGVAFVRYADDVRLLSRTPAGARKALERAEKVLWELGLRYSLSRPTITAKLTPAVRRVSLRTSSRKRLSTFGLM